MNVTKRMILIIATVVLAAVVPGRSSAKSFYVTPGIGLGSLESSIHLAFGLSCTYRDGAPSISARYTHTQEYDWWASPEESATEFAVLAGLTTFGEDGASAGIHLGLGKVWSTRRGAVISQGFIGTRYKEVSTMAWGPALQVDTFMKRVGLSFGANFNDSGTFWTLLLSVRIGNVFAE
jgi:hypothetical protein